MIDMERGSEISLLTRAGFLTAQAASGSQLKEKLLYISLMETGLERYMEIKNEVAFTVVQISLCTTKVFSFESWMG